jgi:CHAD domain-containing protein
LPDQATTTSSDVVSPTPLAELLEDQVVALEAALVELKSDPEGLVHDARVALRKLRSTLRLYAPMLVQEAAKPLRRELSWLAGELGPARDAQVMLARMRGAVSQAGQEEPGGDELLAHFEQTSDRAFDAARVVLASDRLAALVLRLDLARLRTLVASDDAPADLAARDLDRLLRDLDTSGGASDEHLHDLRKAVKRARYVRAAHDDVDTALKKVQAVLGEHQDSVVARQRLAELPASALIDSIVQQEEVVSAESERHLAKAVRKLHKALRAAGASYT